MLITSTLLILVLTHSVTNSALKNDYIQQDYLVKSYNYNHPPLLEAYKASSDEEDFEVRKVRQVENLEYRESENNNYPQNQNADIPVSVVYDSGETLRSNKEQPNSTVNKIKKRKQTRRPNPVNKERKEEEKLAKSEFIENDENATEKLLTTPSPSPSPKTIVPKVFTKRPPEYNPTIKKIRQREPVVKILEASNYVYAHNGNFHYSFEGADGTKVSSEGELKSFNNDKTGEAVVGSVFYKDNEGNDFSLSYTADENGYRPQGAHLPTPPPIPPAIARALKYLATKTTPQPVTEATKFD